MKVKQKYLGKAKLKDMIAGLREAYELVEQEDYEGAFDLLGNKYRIGPDTKNPKGRNVLFLIMEYYTGSTINKDKLFTFVEYLIKAGVDVNSRDKYQLTVLHFAAMRGYPEFCQLLLDNGADPNVIGNDNRTPLDYSIEYYYKGVPECISVLLLGGASPFIPGHTSPSTTKYWLEARAENLEYLEENMLVMGYYRTMEQLRIEAELKNNN